MRLNWNRWSTSLYVIYCRLRCGQRGSTCARHISLDWIGLVRTLNMLIASFRHWFSSLLLTELEVCHSHEIRTLQHVYSGLYSLHSYSHVVTSTYIGLLFGAVLCCGHTGDYNSLTAAGRASGHCRLVRSLTETHRR